MIQPYFEVFYSLLVGGGELQNIEDSLLVILGYQLLPLATSKLMGDNKKFNDSAIFWCILLIVGLLKLQNIEDASLVDLGYQMLPLVISQNMQRFNHILMCFALYFSLRWNSHCAYEPPKWNYSLILWRVRCPVSGVGEISPSSMKIKNVSQTCFKLF